MKYLHLIFSFFWNSQVIFTLALNRSTGHFGGSLCFLLKHTVVFFSTFPTLLLKNVAMMTFQKKGKIAVTRYLNPCCDVYGGEKQLHQIVAIISKATYF